MDNNSKIKTKGITLYAYKITPQSILDKSSDLKELFDESMEKYKTVGERMLKLNPKSEDQDCLLYKESYGDGVFCTLARLAPAGTIGKFPKELLEKELVSSDELPLDDIEGLKYKRITYIYLTESFVILNVHYSKNFETYINEMLKRNGSNLFLLNPYLKQQSEVRLSDISRIKLRSGLNIQLSERQGVWTKIKSLPKEVLSILIEQGVVVEELIQNKLVSAEVNLKFEPKPKEMEKEKYENLLSNAIALDAEGVSVEKKTGGTINAGDFHERKRVKIEHLAGDLLNEIELKQEMSKFSSSLNNNAL